MTIEEFIAEKIKDPKTRELAELHIPAIRRRVLAWGWDVVRKWLYAYQGADDQWYSDLLAAMTVDERRAEDARRLAAVKQMGSDSAMRIHRERILLQNLFTTLLTVLLSKV